MLRKLYDWVFDLARSKHATPAMAVVSFAESSFFPIPPDVMLAPMILARPDRAYFYAGVCTLASVVGGILGYAIGYFLTDVGMMILTWLARRHVRGVEGPVPAARGLGDPDQGADAHPVQADHHRLGHFPVQLRPVRGPVRRDARARFFAEAFILRPGGPRCWRWSKSGWRCGPSSAWRCWSAPSWR
jgi:hypothetical protein